MPVDYQRILTELHGSIRLQKDPGQVADYIPELRRVSRDKFGVSLTTIRGQHFGAGDYEERFSLQSIIKVFTLALAYELEHETLWQRVGVEPSGTPFNSLFQLEYDHGIPRNPFLNAGALVVCDVLCAHFDDPLQGILDFIHHATGLSDLYHDAQVAASEKTNSYRNAALINLMRSYGNIQHDTGRVLDLYIHLCAIEMSCQELSQAFLLLANYGVQPYTGEVVLSISRSKRINAIMQTCGFYDEAGEFSFKVGLPGKSGVGGGIVAVLPGQYCIAVWSPPLNPKGNSYKGMRLLEQFTTDTEASVF